MKKIILSLLMITGFITGKAQTKGTIEIYGYKQAVLPGMIPGDILTEGGGKIEVQAKPRYNFYIYTASKGAIQPLEIWLQGQAYSVQVEKIITPVEYTNPNIVPQSKKVVLVPKTSKKVLKLTLAPSLAASKNKNAKSISEANEMVIVYKQKGKLYYAAQKNLHQIEPVAMQ